MSEYKSDASAPPPAPPVAPPAPIETVAEAPSTSQQQPVHGGRPRSSKPKTPRSIFDKRNKSNRHLVIVEPYTINIIEKKNYYTVENIKKFKEILANPQSEISPYIHSEISHYINYTKLYKIFYYMIIFKINTDTLTINNLSDLLEIFIKIFLENFANNDNMILSEFPEIFMAFDNNIYYYILIALLQAKINDNSLFKIYYSKFVESPPFSTYFLKKEKELYEEFYDGESTIKIDINTIKLKERSTILRIVETEKSRIKIKFTGKNKQKSEITKKRKTSTAKEGVITVVALGKTKKKRKKEKNYIKNNRKKTIKKKKLRFSRKK